MKVINTAYSCLNIYKQKLTQQGADPEGLWAWVQGAQLPLPSSPWQAVPSWVAPSFEPFLSCPAARHNGEN